MEKHFTIECDCNPTLVRILSKLRENNSRMNNIEDTISKIFDLLDNLDDISDLTVALNAEAGKLRQIVPSGT
jgi:hypothetical protein